MYFDSENHRNVTKRKNLSVWNARSFRSFVATPTVFSPLHKNHILYISFIGQSVYVYASSVVICVWCTHIENRSLFPVQTKRRFVVSFRCVSTVFFSSSITDWKISNAKMAKKYFYRSHTLSLSPAQFVSCHELYSFFSRLFDYVILIKLIAQLFYFLIELIWRNSAFNWGCDDFQPACMICVPFNQWFIKGSYHLSQPFYFILFI